MAWNRVAQDFWLLYKTKKSENFEFVIDSGFTNPRFMTYWNSINYNGAIVGLAPYVEQVTGQRYRVVPRIQTTGKFMINYSNSGGNWVNCPALPRSRRVEIAGYLYPLGAMGSMNGTVEIVVTNPTNGAIIYREQNVNRSGSGYMDAYWWSYEIPNEYYLTGVYVSVYLSHDRGTASVDNFMIYIESDLNITSIDGSGNITYDGFVYRNAEDSELTILVSEGRS